MSIRYCIYIDSEPIDIDLYATEGEQLSYQQDKHHLNFLLHHN